MTDRPLRADARDNRAKILTAARSAFDDLGPQANLREIARRANRLALEKPLSPSAR